MVSDVSDIAVLVEGGTFTSIESKEGLVPAQDVIERLPISLEDILNDTDTAFDFIPVHNDDNKPIFIDSSQAEFAHHIRVLESIEIIRKKSDAAILIRGTDSCEDLAPYLYFLYNCEFPICVVTSNESVFGTNNDEALKKFGDGTEFLVSGKRAVGIVDYNSTGELVIRPGHQIRKMNTGGSWIYHSREITNDGIEQEISLIEYLSNKLKRAISIHDLIETLGNHSSFISTRGYGALSTFDGYTPSFDSIPQSNAWIIEGRGNGNLPGHVKPLVNYLIEQDKTIIVTAEPLNGDANALYAAGGAKLEGVIAGGTIPPSAAIALANICHSIELDPAKARELIKGALNHYGYITS